RQVPPLRTTGSINRKPLPQRTTSLQRAADNDPSPSPSSAGSFSRALEESALAQVHPQEGRRSPPEARFNINRQGTQKSAASSNYDDASSVASPDYASTAQE